MWANRSPSASKTRLGSRSIAVAQTRSHPKRESLGGKHGLVDCAPRWADWNGTLLVIAVVGAATIVISTRWGIGLSPDSTVYIGSATSVLQGQGISVLSGLGKPVPMTHYPPLFPSILAGCGAAGIDLTTAARWLNAGLFAANILLVGILVRELTDSPSAATLASFLTYSSVVSLSIHSMAWSEPAFIFFGLSGLALLAAHLQSSRQWLIAPAAGVIALSFLTRYTGAAFVAAGVLGIMFLSASTWKKRFVNATRFSAIACLPITLWVIRNLLVAVPATNRNLVFHPITVDHLKGGISSLASWLLHSLNPAVPRTIRGIIGALVASALLVVFSTANPALDRSRVAEDPIDARKRNLPALPRLLTIFVSVYVLQLVISISFFDAHTPLSNRILSPVHIAFIIVLLFEARALWQDRMRHRPGLRAMSATLCATFCAFSLICTGVWTANRYNHGAGYASPAWYESEIIEYIAGLDATVLVATNAPDAIQILLGRPAQMIPRKLYPSDNTLNPGYRSEMRSLREQLESSGAILVYFDTVDWRWSLPSHREIAQELPLQVVIRADDGSVYRIAD